jgi:8-oxo-dGTP pyrophosphatase MutT (NUDIX family)
MGRRRKEGAARLALIRAAGGVVTRSGATGLQVVLVYRSDRHDWTFPKGKALAGESDEDCALREVEEETGLRCDLELELPATAYVDDKGRDKRVRYWRMTPIGGELAADNEVDDAEWVFLDEARGRLTYERDREVLGALVSGALR